MDQKENGLKEIGINSIAFLPIIPRNFKSLEEISIILVQDRKGFFTPPGASISKGLNEPEDNQSRNVRWSNKEDFEEFLFGYLHLKKASPDILREVEKNERSKESLNIRHPRERALVGALVKELFVYPVQYHMVDWRVENGDRWIQKNAYVIDGVINLSLDGFEIIEDFSCINFSKNDSAEKIVEKISLSDALKKT